MRLRRQLALCLASLALAVPVATAAQSPLAVLSVGSGSGLPGAASIPVSVSLDSQDGAEVVALNFDLSFDSSRVGVGTVEIGSAAASAGKTLTFSRPSANRIRVIVFGLNQTPIDDGAVAVVRFNVLAGASPGTFGLNLSATSASDPDGQGVSVDSSDGSFTVVAPPVVDTATSTQTATPTATRTASPTRTVTPTRTPTRTRTPTSTSSGAATATAPAASRTPTRTRTLAPTSTLGLASNTPGATATTVTPPPGTDSAEGPSSPLPPEATATPVGMFPPQIETAAAATVAAMAEFDAAVMATVTALGQAEAGAPPGMSSGYLRWAVLIGAGGVALAALAGTAYLLWRRGQERGDEDDV